MTDIVTYSAVLGRAMLPGAIYPIEVAFPPGNCLVSHRFQDTISDPRRGIEADVSDCTVFRVIHKETKYADVMQADVDECLLEQALQAISEVIVWSKSHDKAAKVTPFTRQIGRVDVKYFFIEGPNDVIVAWISPLFELNKALFGFASSFMGDMIMSNGPAANPIHPIVRRLMSSIDLINLGFYTESFINLFSLVDDLTQEVLKNGLTKKGLDDKQQKNFLRSIKEDRLKHFLTHLTKLCDWKSLEEEDPVLFGRLAKANTLRNNIMHGSTRIFRTDSVLSTFTLVDTVNWLRGNPFGYYIPPFPVLALAESDFSLISILPSAATPDSD